MPTSEKSKPRSPFPSMFRKVTDVVGLEIGAEAPESGFPAVRLRRGKDGRTEVVAAGRVTGLQGSLPSGWEDAAKGVSWSLRGNFQAPHAALAADSPQGTIRICTLGSGEDTPEPVSENGMRRLAAKVAEPNIGLETLLPEYQVLWLARAFPEGHQPTACSVQVAAAALLNVPANNPAFQTDGGTGFALFVRARETLLVAYHEGHPVLCREHPVGIRQVREALTAQLGVAEELIDPMLAENLIDPLPALRPVLTPLFRQIGMAREFVARRGGNPGRCFLYGVGSGSAHWRRVYEAAAVGVPLETPVLFEGLAGAERLPAEADDPAFMVAYGAACAALEEA